MSEEKIICQKINDKILELDYSKSIKEKKVIIRQHTNTYEVPIDEYAHLMNMVIQVENQMEYTETVFKLLDATKTSCTGKTHLDFPYITDEITKQKIKIINYKKKFFLDDSRQMLTLARECYDRIEKTSCKYGDNITFTSIALSSNFLEKDGGHSGHANMLLILKIKNKSTDTIKFYLYEPHGFDIQDKSILKHVFIKNMFVSELLESIKQVYAIEKKTVIIEIVNKKGISCPIGIQSYVKDSYGYCEMVSNLWLYMIIYLMKSDLSDSIKMYIFDNLNFVEKCLISNEYIYNVLVNFTIQIINIYIINKIRTGIPNFSIHLHDRLISLVGTQMHKYHLEKGRPPLSTYKIQLEKRFEPGDEDEDESCWGNVCRSRSRPPKKEKEEKEGEFNKDNCANCTSNDQCKSNYCEKRYFSKQAKCKPLMPEYYHDAKFPNARLVLGSKCNDERCNSNGECYSTYCSSKVPIRENGKFVRELNGNLKQIDEGVKKCRKVLS